jgi:hypothetical protein
MPTFDFNVTISFRVEAETQQEAAREALYVEQSLNEAGIRSSTGRNHVTRVTAPEAHIPMQTDEPMPSMPAVRSHAETSRRIRQVMGK